MTTTHKFPVQADVGRNVTVPPTTTEPGSTPPPMPPVGDCLCGNFVERIDEADQFERVLSQDPNADIQRPWLVHITLVTDSKQKKECSGSLLNRRWIITAARCFCGTVVGCDNDKDFKRNYTDGDQGGWIHSVD